MNDPPIEPERDYERRLREMNEALLISSVRQHELTEQARAAEAALQRLNETLEERVEERTRQVREKEQRVRELASQLAMAQHEERHRIAQVLHDDLQQLLYSVQIKLLFLREGVESGEREELGQTAAEAERWLAEAVNTTRRLSVDLSPQVLENEGLAETLGWLASQMRELHGLETRIETDGSFQLPKAVRVLLFHVVRELLFNVVKHAGILRAVVELRRTRD